ncbi:hypothetical protein [Roseovarius sp.]|uniref:hypothetical protein n=1 Tax=Roseovarius sp. TaxID=1486281 RepID=UPI002618CBDA|nr:hypothetical protein [Roseovarius sp.]
MTEKFDPKKQAKSKIASVVSKNGLPKETIDKLNGSRDLKRCDMASDKILRDHARSAKKRKSISESRRGLETVLDQAPKRTRHAVKKGWIKTSEDLVRYVEGYIQSKCRLIFADAIEREEKQRLDDEREIDQNDRS